MAGMCVGVGGNQDVGDEFVGFQIVLPLVFALRNYEESIQRQFTRSLWSQKPDFGLIGNQHRGDGRWAYKVGWAAITQDGVIAVLAGQHQRLAIFVLGQQTVAGAEVPAAG